MKILLDFDGTLTNIKQENEFELSYLQKLIQDSCLISADEFNSLFSLAQSVITQNPSSYGWFDNGSLSAFCDEDLFMNIAAVMTLLDTWIDQNDVKIASIKQRMADSHSSFMSLTEETHQAIHNQPLCAFNTPEPEVVAAVNALLDRDCEIVVASNSPASRIIEKFEFVGLKPVDHADNPSAHFRIRGHAQKFALGTSLDLVPFCDRSINVDRPSFCHILQKERPQVIVGDVFSLDLALPLVMAQREPLIYDDMQLYLRVRDYTPQWAVDCMLNPPHNTPVTLRLLNHFNELPSLVLKH